VYNENRYSESLGLQIVIRLALWEILGNTICNSSLEGVAFYLQNMIPRIKKPLKTGDQRLNKEEFLVEHNKLSPTELKATISLLSRFKIEKASLFKDDSWSIDKIRRPFILWLTSLPFGRKKS